MKRLLLVFIAALGLAANARAQSTNQDFPTPVNANEISGAIRARDVGDARLTRYFYTFFADNGDVDLKIETANFDGDIDLFEANTLRPLLKVTIYGGSNASETTARTVYFRKRAQVVLRVEGRTLTDAAARYRINFGGSFAAAAGLPEPPDDSEPRVADKTSPNAIARVNSAGAIIEVLPPKQPAVKAPLPETPATEPAAPTAKETVVAPKPRTRTPRRNRNRRAETATAQTSENDSNKNDSRAANSTNQNSAEKPPRDNRQTPDPNARAAKRNKDARRTTANANRKTERRADANAANAEPPLDPLANLRLVVLLKNNERIERPMTEVFRVSVDKGQLTVINKNGKIERYNFVDVARFAIE